MKSVPRARWPKLAPVWAALIPQLFLLSAHAGQSDYKLLKLEGHNVKWGERHFGAPASVSYAFATKALHFGEAVNCRDLIPIEALVAERLSIDALTRATTEAFKVWEHAAGLSFHEVSDPEQADIIIGAQGRPTGRAFANVTYTRDGDQDVRSIKQALVCLNPELEWKVGYDGDENVYDIQYTLVHEIGHTIGLDHPGPSGQVMAFRYTEAFRKLQPGDLLGAQMLYGPSTAGSASSGNIDNSEPEIFGAGFSLNQVVFPAP